MFKSSTRFSKDFFTLAALIVFASAASAQHNDALVFQNGGQVQMGGMDVDCFSGVGLPGCDPNGNTESVYEAELLETGTSPGLVGRAEEPGFFAVPDGGEAFLPYGDNLPGNAAHSIDLILAPNSPVPGASVLYWDGLGGAVTWSAMPSLQYFDITGIASSGGQLDGTNELLGVQLAATAANGTFDTHPEYDLFGANGTADPAIGFYAIFGRTDIAGLIPSAPWAAVFDFGVENEVLHESAVESVSGFIPEPSTGMLMVIGLLGLARMGRPPTARS